MDFLSSWLDEKTGNKEKIQCIDLILDFQSTFLNFESTEETNIFSDISDINS